MRSLLFVFFLITGLCVSAQYEYTPRCAEAHRHISALRFSAANRLIDEEKRVNPDNLIPLLLDDYMDLIRLFIGEEEHIYDSVESHYSKKRKILRSADRDSPWYRSARARLYLQHAFSRVKFGNYLLAALEARRAFILLEENRELYPGFMPDQLGLGIMHALIGTIPASYRWIASLFAMEGSVEGGRAELYYVLRHAENEGYPFLKDEALFFLSFLELNFQPDKNNALDLLPYYDEHSSENLLLIFSKAKILMMNARNDDAIKLLEERPGNDAYFPFYYLDYLHGLAKLHRLDEDAVKYLLRFTANFSGQTFVKEAYQKVAWYWLIQGDTLGYRTYMDKVLQYGSELSDADRIAMEEAESGIAPDPCLLRSRLLFDGGYYAEADSVLAQASCLPSSPGDSLEYTYRKARIAQMSGDHVLAVDWYDRVIALGAEQPRYFAANAALQAGKIMEADGNFSGAEVYYMQCLDMPNKEYRRSIQQKAKAGLNRIRDKSRDK